MVDTRIRKTKIKARGSSRRWPSCSSSQYPYIMFEGTVNALRIN